jgi:hypothetical protein
MDSHQEEMIAMSRLENVETHQEKMDTMIKVHQE